VYRKTFKKRYKKRLPAKDIGIVGNIFFSRLARLAYTVAISNKKLEKSLPNNKVLTKPL